MYKKIGLMISSREYLIGFFLSFLLTLFISLFPSLAASSTRAAASRSSRKPWKSSKVASKQKRDKR